jgi:hypothetical protein
MRLDQLDSHHPLFILIGMANSWRISHRGVACAFGVLACLSLTLPAKAMADDASDSQSPASVRSQRQGGISLAAFLAKLDEQAEEERPATTENDLVAETIEDMLTLLPYAPPSDLEIVLALPAHFAKRAREAEAAGRHGEATRFAALGGLFEDLLKLKQTTDPQVAMLRESEPPHAQTNASPSIAAAPASLPDDGHNPIAGARDEATTSFSSAMPGREPSPLTVTSGAVAGAPVAQQPAASPIVAVLEKLDKQIRADPATLTGTDSIGETVAELAALLPNAPPSDAKLALAFPMHCATRAHEAEADGRFDEANRFVATSDIVRDLVTGMASMDGGAPQNPLRPAAKSGGSPAIAAAPLLPAGDPANRNAAPVTTALLGDTQGAGKISPPSDESLPIQPQGAVGRPAAESRSNSASANADIAQGRQLSVVALLAKLDKQIATDPPGKTQDNNVAETIEDLLSALRGASSADIRLVLVMPVHFSNRAREAEAEGRHGEANRFVMLAGLLADLFNGTTIQDATSPQPHTDRTVVAANALPSIAPSPKPLDPSGNDRLGDMRVQQDSTMMPPGSTPTLGPASVELAGHDGGGVAVGPGPIATNLTPLRAAEAPLDPPNNRSAKGDAGKPLQTPDLRVALLAMPSEPGGADTKPPLATLLISPDRTVNPHVVAKVAPLPRAAVPPLTRVVAPTAHAALDPQCRAIALKFELGEEPSDAERSYLRQGCRQHG